jgi:RNA polymerase sigma-70 factor (ECF subfamily)
VGPADPDLRQGGERGHRDPARGRAAGSAPRPLSDHRAAVEAVFREEAGRIVAALIRVSGSFDLAEEALQEAFAAAVAHWEKTGIPSNPGAWITTAAQRKLVDFAHRARTRKSAHQGFGDEVARQAGDAADDPEPAVVPYPDDRLRLIFTCCHPALNVEAQVALTQPDRMGLSQTAGGLTFLTGPVDSPDPTRRTGVKAKGGDTP